MIENGVAYPLKGSTLFSVSTLAIPRAIRGVLKTKGRTANKKEKQLQRTEIKDTIKRTV